MTLADLVQVFQRKLIMLACDLHFAQDSQRHLGGHFRVVTHEIAVLESAGNTERLQKGSFSLVWISKAYVQLANIQQRGELHGLVTQLMSDLQALVQVADRFLV